METPRDPEASSSVNQDPSQSSLDYESDMITAYEGLPDSQRGLVHKRVVNLYYGSDNTSSESAITQAMEEFYTDGLPDGYLPFEIKNPLDS